MLLDDRLSKELEKLKRENLYRARTVRQGKQGALIRIGECEYLNFSSNDYLGLASHPLVIQAFKAGLDTYGVGSGGSALITGNTQIHQKLEEKLAERTKRSKVLLFNSGFTANVGIIDALVGRGDHLLLDRLSHASLIDGARLAGAKLLRYRHVDMDHLDQLTEKKQAKTWVVTESLFSMDGDQAPLQQIADLCDRRSAHCYVDDAHGFGVYGENGAGCVNAAGLSQQEVPVLIATFGKAVGVGGAFVAGSEVLVETLIQKARTSIYTTAMPPAQAAAILQSLELIEKEAWRREKLFERIAQFRKGACDRQIPLADNAHGPIQPIILKDSEKVMNVSNALLNKGIKVSAIRPPTVPRGTARLRITITAAHKKEHVDKLLSALSDILNHV